MSRVGDFNMGESLSYSGIDQGRSSPSNSTTGYTTSRDPSPSYSQSYTTSSPGYTSADRISDAFANIGDSRDSDQRSSYVSSNDFGRLPSGFGSSQSAPTVAQAPAPSPTFGGGASAGGGGGVTVRRSSPGAVSPQPQFGPMGMAGQYYGFQGNQGTGLPGAAPLSTQPGYEPTLFSQTYTGFPSHNEVAYPGNLAAPRAAPGLAGVNEFGQVTAAAQDAGRINKQFLPADVAVGVGLTDQDTVDLAKGMLADGAAPEDIWSMTAGPMGLGGIWAGPGFENNPGVWNPITPDQISMPSSYDQLSGTVPEGGSQLREGDMYATGRGRPDTRLDFLLPGERVGYTTPMGNVLDNPTLYAAAPELRDSEVMFPDMPMYLDPTGRPWSGRDLAREGINPAESSVGAVYADYAPNSNTMAMYPSFDPVQNRDTSFVHELQHATDDYFGSLRSDRPEAYFDQPEEIRARTAQGMFEYGQPFDPWSGRRDQFADFAARESTLPQVAPSKIGSGGGDKAGPGQPVSDPAVDAAAAAEAAAMRGGYGTVYGQSTAPTQNMMSPEFLDQVGVGYAMPPEPPPMRPEMRPTPVRPEMRPEIGEPTAFDEAAADGEFGADIGPPTNSEGRRLDGVFPNLDDDLGWPAPPNVMDEAPGFPGVPQDGGPAERYTPDPAGAPMSARPDVLANTGSYPDPMPRSSPRDRMVEQERLREQADLDARERYWDTVREYDRGAERLAAGDRAPENEFGPTTIPAEIGADPLEVYETPPEALTQGRMFSTQYGTEQTPGVALPDIYGDSAMNTRVPVPPSGNAVGPGNPPPAGVMTMPPESPALDALGIDMGIPPVSGAQDVYAPNIIDPDGMPVPYGPGALPTVGETYTPPPPAQRLSPVDVTDTVVGQPPQFTDLINTDSGPVTYDEWLGMQLGQNDTSPPLSFPDQTTGGTTAPGPQMPSTNIAPPPGTVPAASGTIGTAVQNTLSDIGDVISNIFGGDGGGPFGLPADSRTPEEVWEEFNAIADSSEGEDRRALLEAQQSQGGAVDNGDGTDDGNGDDGNDGNGGTGGDGGTTLPTDPLTLYEMIYGVPYGSADPFFYYPVLNDAVRANYTGNVPNAYPNGGN